MGPVDPGRLYFYQVKVTSDRVKAVVFPLALIPLPALISLMECPSVGEKRALTLYVYCQPFLSAGVI
jgi:hypothetical protein